MRRRTVTLARRDAASTDAPALEPMIRGWATLRSALAAAVEAAPVASFSSEPSLLWGEPSNFEAGETNFEEQANNPGGYRVGDGIGGAPPNVQDIVYDFNEIPEGRLFHEIAIPRGGGLFSHVDVTDQVVFDGPDFTGELAAQRKKRSARTSFGSSPDFLYSGLVTDSLTGERRPAKVTYTFFIPSHHDVGDPPITTQLSPWEHMGGELPI